ncbi:MAG TPA: LacI family DNA-binding transcriptional regulator [Acidobacteriaceae bacterium]|nr:LacI family DNA-binding transcriptional regulator [Acidobacteriaceae bacterium]
MARHARVSIATVSRAINGVPSVDKRLAKRVFAAIEELNYYPNTQARTLVSGRSRIFGLLVSEITNPFFPELIQGFEDVAVENGYEIMISSTNYDLARMENCIRRLLERNVEGVAVMTFGIEAPLLEKLVSRDVPLVFMDVGLPNPRVSTLKVDYHRGIREGVQHLAALTHRRIAFVSGPLRQLSCELRKAAFVTSLEEIGVTPDPTLLLEGDHTLEGGIAAAEHFLRSKNLPTAVMCSNDMTAIGVLRSFLRAGVRIPEEVSVIGFDDIHLAEFVHPPLTTVNMSRVAIARAAFEALRAHVEQIPRSAKQRRTVIPTGLTIRQSTGFPRKTVKRVRARDG